MSARQAARLAAARTAGSIAATLRAISSLRAFFSLSPKAQAPLMVALSSAQTFATNSACAALTSSSVRVLSGAR